ncbi:hypothetical protein SMICM17S_02059 [Streptomyces microflavus]
MRYVIAVAETNNFTRAAQRCLAQAAHTGSPGQAPVSAAASDP